MELSRKAQAYALVKGQILDGTLKSGDVISEKTFIDLLGFSRTPVHEALAQLAEEGLVRIMPSRGMVVSPISVGDITMIYQARSILETGIVRLLAEQASPLLPREVEDVMKHLEGDEDSAFHSTLARLTHNRYLEEMERKLMTQCQRIRLLSTQEDGKRKQLAESEHQEILDAVQKKDGNLAAERVVHHLDRTLDDYAHIFSTSTMIQL